MRIFPPFKKIKVKIKNPESFKDYIREITEPKYGNTNHIAKLKGTISKSGFLLEKKTNIMNSVKPRIKGKYIRKNDKIEEVELNIESTNFPILAIIMMLIFCVYGAFIKSFEYAFLIFIVGFLFIYLISWVLFLIDLKKTLVELNDLIDRAST